MRSVSLLAEGHFPDRYVSHRERFSIGLKSSSPPLVIPAKAGIQGPHVGCLPHAPGSPEFTNEVQHLSKVLQWESNMSTCHWKTGAGLPVFMKTGNPSAKSLQLWIARHRRFLAS